MSWTGFRTGVVCVLIGALGLLLWAGTPAFAEDSPQAKTAGDPGIDVAELELLLKPLRRAQLGAEAEAWAGLLEQKVQEISDLRISSLETNGKGDEVDAAAAAKEKEQILDQLALRQEEKVALLKRVNVVLQAWTDKGGDASELTEYVGQVSGVQIDVRDASAAWTMLKTWLLSPDGGLKVGKGILFFLLILLATKILAGILAALVGKGLRKVGRTPELLRVFLTNLIRNLLFFLGFVIALGVLGINIGPLMAVIGAAGLAIAFALQGTLSNFASGVMILLYRPFDMGDVINAAGVTGKVDAMTLTSTTIKTADNQVMIVPNSQIWDNVITNVTGSATRRVDMVFGIGYDDDLAKAQKVLEGILDAHPLVLKDPAPVVGVGALADSSVNFNVRPWTKTGDYWTVFGDVTRTVKERFDEEGISIPFPQQDVHMHQVAPA